MNKSCVYNYLGKKTVNSKKAKYKARETYQRSYKECESICAVRKKYDMNCHGCKYYQTKECLKLQCLN